MLGDDGTQKFTQLMLVDRESEKNKWIDALHELHRIIRRNKLLSRNVSVNIGFGNLSLAAFSSLSIVI